MDSYFSLDSILASESRVYCTLTVPAPHFAHLSTTKPVQSTTEEDRSLPSHALPRGHRLALPFWLMSALASRGVLAVQLPRCYAEQSRQMLRADPAAVTVGKWCRAYYTLGARLAALVRDEGLARMLGLAFGARCWHVVDKARWGGRKQSITSEHVETSLYWRAVGLEVAERRWKERRTGTIVSCKKRHREQIGSPVTPGEKRRR